MRPALLGTFGTWDIWDMGHGTWMSTLSGVVVVVVVVVVAAPRPLVLHFLSRFGAMIPNPASQCSPASGMHKQKQKERR
jgi:hypothetical protein